MTKKVLFQFAGTGILASSERNLVETDSNISDDVIRVYFNGCQDPNIGGRTTVLGYLFPNLDHVASTLRQCFDNEKKLSLKKLKELFGDAVIIEPSSILNQAPEPAEHIVLSGFSRGGITTFAVARHLDNLGIPISLLAQDPVIGESRASSSEEDSLYQKNFDLSQCKNLVRAEITISAYSKHVDALHNKFYRQMAPIFGNHTSSNIYIMPNHTHYNYTQTQLNHCVCFLIANDIGITSRKLKSLNVTNVLLVPKVEQQKFHYGVVGRLTHSPYIKETLTAFINSKRHKLPNSYKAAVALSIMIQRYDNFSDTQPKFYHHLIEDDSIKGQSIREFVVEIASIFKYVHKEKGEVGSHDTNACEKKIDRLIMEFIELDEPTLTQRMRFEANILNTIQELQERIPEKTFQSIFNLSKLFLEENTLTHINLTRFIDEHEPLAAVKDGGSSKAVAFDLSVNNAMDLAKKLYYSSARQRPNVFQLHAPKLDQLLQSANDVADIAQFLDINQLNQMMNLKCITHTIKTMEDIFILLDQMPTHEHRKAVYNSIKNKISSMKITQIQVLKFMEYLSINKCKELLGRLPLDKMPEGKDVLFYQYYKLSRDKQLILFEDAGFKAIVQKMIEGKIRLTTLNLNLTKVLSDIIYINQNIISSIRESIAFFRLHESSDETNPLEQLEKLRSYIGSSKETSQEKMDRFNQFLEYNEPIIKKHEETLTRGVSIASHYDQHIQYLIQRIEKFMILSGFSLSSKHDSSNAIQQFIRQLKMKNKSIEDYQREFKNIFTKEFLRVKFPILQELMETLKEFIQGSASDLPQSVDNSHSLIEKELQKINTNIENYIQEGIEQEFFNDSSHLIPNMQKTMIQLKSNMIEVLDSILLKNRDQVLTKKIRVWKDQIIGYNTNVCSRAYRVDPTVQGSFSPKEHSKDDSLDEDTSSQFSSGSG